MFLLVVLLSNHSMNDSLDDEVFGSDALHILDHVVSFVDFIIFQVVDNEVESGFGDHVDQGWEHLKCILTTSENNEVVSKKIIISENVSGLRVVLQDLQFSFGSFSVIKLIVVASLQIDTDNRITIQTEIHSKNLKRNIIVVHFVVAESDIDVDSVEVFVFNQ